MEIYSTADCLPESTPATVVSVALPQALTQRLTDLGLLPGTKLLRTLTAPSGSPIAFSFRGSVVALRSQDAQFIRCKWEVRS